jgi:hypothetical protein
MANRILAAIIVAFAVNACQVTVTRIPEPTKTSSHRAAPAKKKPAQDGKAHLSSEGIDRETLEELDRELAMPVKRDPYSYR